MNYGRLEDFMWLKERGINFSGCICIARNEQLYRGNKVLVLSLSSENEFSRFAEYMNNKNIHIVMDTSI